MSEKTYTGSCHCGRVRFQATLDLENEFATCNCSICSRSGWVLAFVPEGGFEVQSGADAITDYQFGPKRLHHPFCSTCGVRAYSHGVNEGKLSYAVNLRCLEGVDAAALKSKQFDGKSL